MKEKQNPSLLPFISIISHTHRIVFEHIVGVIAVVSGGTAGCWRGPPAQRWNTAAPRRQPPHTVGVTLVTTALPTRHGVQAARAHARLQLLRPLLLDQPDLVEKNKKTKIK